LLVNAINTTSSFSDKMIKIIQFITRIKEKIKSSES